VSWGLCFLRTDFRQVSRNNNNNNNMQFIRNFRYMDVHNTHSSHLTLSDLIPTEWLTSFSSELSSLWLDAATANWVIAVNWATQYAVAETKHPALTSNEMKWIDIRWDKVRQDEWEYEHSLSHRACLLGRMPCGRDSAYKTAAMLFYLSCPPWNDAAADGWRLYWH